MEQFDVIVVGSGSGMLIASAAVEQGMSVALVEHGRMGGTCINVGCVPSKMLIYPADVLATIKEAEKVGIKASINKVDFNNIMTRMHTLVDHDTKQQATAVEVTPKMKWFKDRGEFIADYTMKVGKQTIKAKKIFVATGTRTLIPPIKGLQNIEYLTSDTVLELKTQPKSIIIVGGGYIGMEYGHFFSALGTKTIIVHRENRVLPEEEPEVSELLQKEITKHLELFTEYEAIEVKQDGPLKTLIAKNLRDNTEKQFTAQALMIAAGRKSNSEELKPEKSGIELDKKGFIVANEYLETKKKNIYAFGDAIGIQMFRHAANYEAGIVWHNANQEHKVAMDFSATPHAVFTHPQIASVGLKEQEAKNKYDIAVGIAKYKDTAMGAAMGYPEGFVKVIVERETGKILGAHIVGPEASVLVQEITNVMVTGKGDFSPIARGMHIHPALNEVVQNAFGNLHTV